MEVGNDTRLAISEAAVEIWVFVKYKKFVMALSRRLVKYISVNEININVKLKPLINLPQSVITYYLKLLYN